MAKVKSTGKFTKTYELCPHCETEVKISTQFIVQDCPNCKAPIMPCSICDATNDNIPQPKCSCDKCPLETNEYRDKLISATFNACFADDSVDNRDSNLAYLNSLSNSDLSIKLSEKNTEVEYFPAFFDDEDEE